MRCGKCGRVLPGDSSFCQWCGGAQPEGYEEPADWDGGEWQAPRERGASGFNLFRAGGRLNRLKYFYVLLMYYIGLILCYASVYRPEFWSGSAAAVMATLYVAVATLLFAVAVIAMVKRFHDLDEPGANVFTLLIPLYNIYVGLKLLFAGSPGEANAYGRRDGNGHYWQVPLVLVLVPALFFAAGAYMRGSGFPAAAWAADTPAPRAGAAAPAHADDPAATPLPTLDPLDDSLHYYNAKLRVSMDLPRGWATEEQDGYLVVAHNFGNTKAITVSAEATDNAPFTQYSESDFDSFKGYFKDKEEFARDYGYESSEITSSGILCEDRYINGYRFIQIRFTHSFESKQYAHYYVFGNYDSKELTLQFILPSDTGEEEAGEMLAWADTLRFGADAVPGDGG